MIQLEGVGKVFGAGAHAFRALDDVTVSIRKNEFFTLLGPSGCGKTTLLRVIAGFEAPSAGRLLLDGVDITDTPPFARPVNTVFQNYALFPHMTVAENIGFGLEMLGRPKAEIRDTVARMLAMVRMEPMAHRRTSQISGGQQQRVALARALAPRPKVLLLDEPLSALDLKLRKEMQIELKRLQHETGITFVFVTHDQEEALTMSDRVAVMSTGRMLQVGAPRDIYERPADRFVADFIGETNFLEAEVVGRQQDGAAVRLPGGAVVLAGLPEGGLDGATRVTLAIRPELADLAPNGALHDLTARVETVVYFGTDTHYHLRLADGAPFVVRRQNRRDGAPEPAAGAEVGVRLEARAAQVLQTSQVPGA